MSNVLRKFYSFNSIVCYFAEAATHISTRTTHRTVKEEWKLSGKSFCPMAVMWKVYNLIKQK